MYSSVECGEHGLAGLVEWMVASSSHSQVLLAHAEAQLA